MKYPEKNFPISQQLGISYKVINDRNIHGFIYQVLFSQISLKRAHLGKSAKAQERRSQYLS